MKILPANSAETIEMAEHLLEEWLCRDIPVRVPQSKQRFRPTIEFVREVMAISFGWDSWKELLAKADGPHEPVYIDDSVGALDDVAMTMAYLIGYERRDSWILALVQRSGAGHSPTVRKHNRDHATPWGKVLDRTIIAPGLQYVTAERHNGIVLSLSRSKRVPRHLSLDSHFYHGYRESKLVELAFPVYFKDRLEFALTGLSIFTICSLPCKPEALVSQPPDRLGVDLLGDYDIDESIRDESLNRNMTVVEQAVVNYLAQCVRFNRKPIQVPDSNKPSLQDWIECLSRVNQVDGKWPMSSESWKKHFYRVDQD